MSFPILKLKKNECRRIRAGHLWVFSNEVDTRTTPLSQFSPGEIVTIVSNNGRPLANAYINPNSLICARIYSHNTKQKLDSEFLQSRIQQAFQLRNRRFEQPYYRLVYSESDLLPGLVVDRFDDTMVLQISTQGMDCRENEIITALEQTLPISNIVLNNNTSARKQEGLDCFAKIIKGAPGETLQVVENNSRFAFSTLAGQKTGWFYDHRLNRLAMQNWVKQKRVLDVFSYLGGWGIQALVAGAQSVTCVEASKPACEFISTNADLNNVSDKLNIINDDAFETLSKLKHANEKFDLVVLDPPAFIKRKKDLKQGTAAYQRLNKLAMQLLAENGMVISASCSYHFSREQHLKVIRTCAQQIGLQAQIVEEGRPGPDHPLHPAIPESNYLSCFTLRLLK